MKQKSIVAFLILFLTLVSSRAYSTPENCPELVDPAHRAAKILVVKSERTMYLYDRKGDLINSYSVSLGPNPEGKKTEEDDGKTPEGHYFIDARNDNSDYYLSLRISYPSSSDAKHAKEKGSSPGGAIFIHGSPNGKEWMTWKYSAKHDWTQGCIAVSNDEMRELWSLVAEGTPITIIP